MWRIFLVLGMVVSTPGAGTMVGQTKPLEPGSYEVFGEVRYLGGSARVSKVTSGVLVVTDTALLFVEYRNHREVKDDPLIVIPLRNITRLVWSADRHEGPVFERLMLGRLANSQRDELVAVAYDADETAEAPVFKTKAHESATLMAKIRARLKRLDIRLPEGVTDTVPER